METRAGIRALLVPVNPGHDLRADPARQTEYVNPVTLNNMQVVYANKAIEVTEAIVANNRKLAALKARQAKAEGQLEDIERVILTEHPAPAADRKSNKLLEAYLERMAHETGRTAEIRAAREELRTIKNDMLLIEAEIDSGRQVWAMLRLVGEHGQTHLSFVKDEYKRAGSYR